MYKILLGLFLIGSSTATICFSFQPIRQVTEFDSSQSWLTGQPVSTIAPPPWGGTLRLLAGYPLLAAGFASVIWGTVQLINHSLPGSDSLTPRASLRLRDSSEERHPLLSRNSSHKSVQTDRVRQRQQVAYKEPAPTSSHSRLSEPYTTPSKPTKQPAVTTNNQYEQQPERNYNLWVDEEIDESQSDAERAFEWSEDEDSSEEVEKGRDERREHQTAEPITAAPQNQNFIVVPSNQKYQRFQDIADADLKIEEEEDWLEDFIFEPDPYNPSIKKFRHANFKIDGINGSGKSTLGEFIMAKASGGKPIERYLINPKHISSKPDWSFEPFCADIEETYKAIVACQKIMRSRISDPSFDDRIAAHQFFIIDEHDWIYNEYGAKYISAIRSIFKVCRALNGHVFICGQSQNAKDTGLSGADFDNMGRIVIGITAIKFFNNPQFPYTGSLKEALYQKAVEFQEAKKRFALVIPSTGLPSIRLIPYIEPFHRSSKVVNLSKR